MIFLQTGPSENESMGRFSVCSSICPVASYNPVTKSFASHKIGERVVFVSEMLISSVMALNDRRKIDRRILSIMFCKPSAKFIDTHTVGKCCFVVHNERAELVNQTIITLADEN